MDDPSSDDDHWSNDDYGFDVGPLSGDNHWSDDNYWFEDIPILNRGLTPTPPYDIDADGATNLYGEEYDEWIMRYVVEYAQSNRLFWHFPNDQLMDAAKAKIRDGFVKCYESDTLEQIDLLIEWPTSLSDPEEYCDGFEVIEILFRNIQMASEALWTSLKSQFALDVDFRNPETFSKQDVVFRYLAHRKKGLRETARSTWLGQLSIEYDVLRLALKRYLIFLEVKQPIHLIVRLPQLGCLFFDPDNRVSYENTPRIVLVDWIDVGGGTKWIGLDFAWDDENATEPLSHNILSSTDDTYEACASDSVGDHGVPTDKAVPAEDEKLPRVLPGELLDQCVERDARKCKYLHVYIKKIALESSDVPLSERLRTCSCRDDMRQSTRGWDIRHEYRVGTIVPRPLWFAKRSSRADAIAQATPKAIRPETEEYIFELLNSGNQSRLEVMNEEHVNGIVAQALDNVSHLIVLDGDEDLEFGCLDCLHRAIWEKGAFAAGIRDRRLRSAFWDEYDPNDESRHGRGPEGNFVRNHPVIDWASKLYRMTIVVTPRLKKLFEKAKDAQGTIGTNPWHSGHEFPHIDEDISDDITKMRDTFDPSHLNDKAASHPLQHQLGMFNPRLHHRLDRYMCEENLAVFLMQGKRPLDTSRIGNTEEETKAYLPARPGLFYNALFPLQGPTIVDRPENGWRSIFSDVNLNVLFSNFESAMNIIARLSSQPWSFITDKESRFLRDLLDTDTPVVDLVRSLRYLRDDPASSIAIFYDTALTPARTENMPEFLADSALANNPIVHDEIQIRANLATFEATFSEPREFIWSCKHTKFQMDHFDVEVNHVTDFSKLMMAEREVRLDFDLLWNKWSEIAENLNPLYPDDVLEQMDRNRWLAWGKQDHLIYYDPPRTLNEDMGESWNGHNHRAEFCQMLRNLRFANPATRQQMMEDYRDMVWAQRHRRPVNEGYWGHILGEHARHLHDEEMDRLPSLAATEQAQLRLMGRRHRIRT